MSNSKQAPEIFQHRIDELDLTGLPPRDSDRFEQSLIGRYALDYAQRGWNALVTVDGDFVRVLGIPENSVEPKAYVIGMLQHGFLEDALPILFAMSGMVNDADIEYNLGICLSELGRIQECIAPLEMCLTLDPSYANAYIGLGVAYSRLGKNDLAETALRDATRLEPENAYAKRNLAGILARSGKPKEALPYFRQAVSLEPKDPGALLGLAQCLDEIGGESLKEAGLVYEQILKQFPEHPVSDAARSARNRLSNDSLHQKVDGNIRMDVVMYMQGAANDFAKLPKMELGQIVMEIALLGQNGLKINDPDIRYNLKSKPGDYSGLQLLSMMHVGIKQLEPNADTESGLDREYAVAMAMRAK
jgi:tetratricopeptide (TPR) repeat protein